MRDEMTFFSTDLFRQIGFGFLIGTAVLVVANAGVWFEEISPPAHAAQLSPAPSPSSEFLIEPII